MNQDKKRRGTKMKSRENLIGYLFASPWLLGFFIFTLYPMCSSLYYSFTNYNTLKTPTWIGIRNYIVMCMHRLVCTFTSEELLVIGGCWEGSVSFRDLGSEKLSMSY